MTMVNTRSLYSQQDFPVFQNRMYDSEAEAMSCPLGDIHLVEDQGTGLVFNQSFDESKLVYDNNYQNEQAHSPAFKLHLERVAEIVSSQMGEEKLVEVGCGKGFFLELLLQGNFDIVGYDPTYEGSNPRIRAENFRPDVVGGPANLILRHVLEHIQHPFDFLKKLNLANEGTGKIYIEVPCLDWIFQHRAWFDIFYEHVNYFRLCDFQKMFGRILECGHLFGGQYIYIVADLATLKRPEYSQDDAVQFPAPFAPKKVSYPGDVVWGGASKGVIFSLLRQRIGFPVSIVIDINPSKQGRYLPVTGLRVQSPDEALSQLSKGAKIYVMNSNYLDEIERMSGGDYICIGVDSE